MEKWWRLSLDPISKSEADRQFEDSLRPTFDQALLDRCIVRAAIACQTLPESDLRKIADEQDLEEWAERLGRLATTCEILRRQAESRACPTIMITGPTCTGKSFVAWELARLIDGVVIAADPFQMCAVPPIGLGVGLPPHLPPPGIRTRLYRSQVPGIARPSPDMVADWVAAAVSDAVPQGLPRIIEGGSITSAATLWKRRIPTHAVVFDAEPRDAEVRVQTRMSTDEMSVEHMLAEARAVRASGNESTWVAQESLVYPKLFGVLDGRASRNEMLSRIRSDWQTLIANQQKWFDELRAMDGVLALSPSRQSAESVAHLVGLEPGPRTGLSAR
jgi:tRNA A37 N6-isopentenylltransferase MiaA